MKPNFSRDVKLLATTIFCSYLLGEVSPIFSLWSYLICPLILVFGVIFCIKPFKRDKIYNIVLSVVFIVFSFSALIAGVFVSNNAIFECQDEMSKVCEELDRYREEKGEYPEKLADLSIPEPGKKLLTGGTFNFKSERSKYHLSYYDGLVEFVATESTREAIK